MISRRGFLSKLFLGAAAIAVAPKILASRKPYVKPKLTTEGVIPYMRRIAEMKPNLTPLDTIVRKVGEKNGWCYSSAEQQAMFDFMKQYENAMFYGLRSNKIQIGAGGIVSAVEGA